MFWGDTPWYLNRAPLLREGILREPFVYTLGFPIAVSVFQIFTGNLLAAAILINRIAAWGFTVGSYMVGHMFFGRKVGLLTFLLTVCCTLLRWISRHLQPHLLFFATVVFIVIAFWLLLRFPGIRAALFMGVMVNISFFTRFEGIIYTILLPIAGIILYRKYGWFAAFKVVLISGIVIGIGFVYYMAVLIPASDPTYRGSFSLLTVFLQDPFPTEVLWTRFTQMLDSFFIIWQFPVWIIGLIAGIQGWRRGDNRLGYGICLLILGINVFIQYVIATEPHYRILGPVYPFIVILFLDFFIQVGKRFPKWKYFAVAPIVFLINGEVLRINLLAMRPVPDVRSYPEYQAAQSLDLWIEANGYSDKLIFTFCRTIIPFTNSKIEIMYRLAFRDEQSPDNWNSPENLFELMSLDGSLFMTCPDYDKIVYWRDWRDWLEGKSDIPYTLVEVGRNGDFILYRSEADTNQ